MVAPDAGVLVDGHINGSSKAVATVAFISIVLYNFIELNFIMLATFKRHSGLYFWSFVIATWALPFNGVGILLKNLSLCEVPGVYTSLMVFSWPAMVTGQSLVLYSRLHLVLYSKTALRYVLGMIISTAIVCYPPIMIIIFAAHFASNPEPYLIAYAIYERFQITIFFIQEAIISGLYIWQTIKIRRLESSIQSNGTAHRMLIHLLIVNVIVILFDISVLVLEYSGFYYIQTAWKVLVYSVKLKLEFCILNKLVDLAHEHSEQTLSDRPLTNSDTTTLEASNDGRCSQSIKNSAGPVRPNPETAQYQSGEVC